MLLTFIPSVTDSVIQLCRRIHASNSPDYVQVRPRQGAKAGDCFINVRSVVEAEGGKIQYGWAIWQCAKYYLEAEHHAVHEPASGPPWVDVTPSLVPTTERILFLPDDIAVYDFNTDQLRDNIRMPLLDDKRVQEYCELSGERIAMLNSAPGFGTVQLSDEKAQRIRLLGC